MTRVQSTSNVIGISSASDCGPADSPRIDFAAITAWIPRSGHLFGQVATTSGHRDTGSASARFPLIGNVLPDR